MTKPRSCIFLPILDTYLSTLTRLFVLSPRLPPDAYVVRQLFFFSSLEDSLVSQQANPNLRTTKTRTSMNSSQLPHLLNLFFNNNNNQVALSSNWQHIQVATSAQLFKVV